MILQGNLISSISIQICIVIWLSIVSTGFGANILIVCPAFAKSSYRFHVALARSLHAAGHKITIIHPFSNDAASKNFTVIDSSVPDQPNESNFVHIDKALEKTGIFSLLLWTRDLSENDCHNTIQLDKIQKILYSKEKQFDVMILFLIRPLYECFSSIAEILNIPIVGTSTTNVWWKSDWLTGNPNDPATIPSEFSNWSSRMNFIHRLTNSWYWTINYLFENLFIYPRLEVFYKKHFPNLSAAQRIKPSLIFANSHQILIPRPLVPNVINIGGIHMQSQPAKPLPQYLQKFIDEAKDGAILFTFGSIARMFEENSTQWDIFKTAFSQIPQRVIWKMEKKVENLPNNVMAAKWLPQRDILAHKNVVAFITHCGLFGIFEAIFEAKPLIMMPIIFDQKSNAAILEDLGVGISLDIKTLSIEKVLKALNNIIQDTKYRKQMQNISQIIKDAPITQEEAVVYWTEHVIRHKGAPYLRTTTAGMPLNEYLLLDIILFVSGVLLAFVCFSFCCCKKLFDKKIGSHKHINHNNKKTK